MELDWYKEIIDFMGPPEQAQKVGPAYAETYRGRVPDWLIRFWLDFGWGSWGEGQSWLCDPALMQPVVEELFAGDPLIDPERTIIFCYTAFGRLLGWHSSVGTFDIDFLVFDGVGYSNEDMRRAIDTGRPFSKDAEFGGALSTATDYIWTDEEGDPMLPQAIARLGRLAPGEIYGFFPALKMGGVNRVESLRRVRAVEHLLFLSQLGRLWLHEYHLPDPNDPANPYGGSRFLRRLGPQ